MKNFLGLLIASCIALGIAEGGYRIAKWITKPAGLKNPAVDAYDDPLVFERRNLGLAAMQYDSYLAYIAQADFHHPAYKQNHSHFRYPENFSEDKPANEIRIFFTGGSTAWGVGVTQDTLYTTVLEKMLAAQLPGKKVRVVTSAAGGYCSTQERIMLQNRLLQYHPDLLVMLSGWNDTYFGYRGKNILHDNDFLYYRDKLEGVHPSLHPLDPPVYDQYGVKLHYLWKRFLYAQRFPSREKLELAIKSASQPTQETIGHLKHNIHLVTDTASRFNFPLIYYLQPCVYSTTKTLTPWEKTLVDWGEKNEIGFPDYLRQAYQTYRRDLPLDAGENGYEFFDGDLAIQNESKSVFADTVHLGDRGNRLFAIDLAKKILPLIKGK